MSKENPYIQFPLCALAFGQRPNERLNAILDYGVVEAGEKLWRQVAREEQKRMASVCKGSRDVPKGFHGELALHCATLYGAQKLNIEFKDIRTPINGHKSLAAFIAGFQGRQGRDALVRIKKEWVFKVRDKRGLTYREFAVLGALYSCIGDKQATRVTQPRIRRCALGYRTERIMAAELPRRADGAAPLTPRQVRDTIARLHRNNFFCPLHLRPAHHVRFQPAQ